MTDTRWLSTEDAARLFGYPSANEVLALFYIWSRHWSDDAKAPTEDALSLGIVKRDDADQKWVWHYPFLVAVGVYWQVPGLQEITGYPSPAHAIDLIRQGVAQVSENNPAWAGDAKERQQRMGDETFHITEILQDEDLFLTSCAWQGMYEANRAIAIFYTYLRDRVDREHPGVAAGLKLAASGIAMATEINALHPYVSYGLISLEKPSQRRQPAQPLGEEVRGIQNHDADQEDWLLKLKKYARWERF